MKILNSNTKKLKKKNNGSDNCPTIQGMKQKKWQIYEQNRKLRLYIRNEIKNILSSGCLKHHKIINISNVITNRLLSFTKKLRGYKKALVK